ncbi:MAG: hypothetical protein WC438_06165 [Candidatus Pacearchaeota archaeon]
MNPQEIQQSLEAVINGLTPLAQQLQVPLNKLFEYAIRQNYVIAISDLIYYILGILLTIVFINFLIWGNKKNEKNEYRTNFIELEWPMVIAIVGGIFLLIFDLFLSFNIQLTLARFINPEYMALKDLFNLIIK